LLFQEHPRCDQLGIDAVCQARELMAHDRRHLVGRRLGQLDLFPRLPTDESFAAVRGRSGRKQHEACGGVDDLTVGRHASRAALRHGFRQRGKEDQDVVARPIDVADKEPATHAQALRDHPFDEGKAAGPLDGRGEGANERFGVDAAV
jgi:hypothetical protein